MFTFVTLKIKLKNCDWMDYGTVLKIENKEQVLDYFWQNKHFNDAFKDFNDNWYKGNPHFTHKLTVAIYNYAVAKEDSFVNSMAKMASGMLKTMFEILDKGDIIYVGFNGGIIPYSGQPKQEELVYEHENLVWPEYNLDRIEITKFDGGTHYYANVGNTRVVIKEYKKYPNSDRYNYDDFYYIEKWNTWDEAREAAIKFLEMQQELRRKNPSKYKKLV